MSLYAALLQDDYELEEFKALEQQIKKDVCGSVELPTVKVWPTSSSCKGRALTLIQ